jgi:hypothetical protein
MILNNLRHLFKGHKISEPNFGDRNHNVSKPFKKALNNSLDKKFKKKTHKKPLNYTDLKSTKATPKKYIDFTAYLNNNKKKHAMSSFNKIKKREPIITSISKESNGSRNKMKNELSKSDSSLKSSQSRNKKSTCLIKQKETVDRLLNKYNFRSNHLVKTYRKRADYKTSKMEDRVLNITLSNHKKSNADLIAKYKSIHRNSTTNNSFISKKFSKAKLKKIEERKKSSSSSPDIRTSPNSIAMLKNMSKNDVGYVNPKRKSYNTNNPLKAINEKKYQLPSNTTAASIKSSTLGSGRSTEMSNLAKNANKYLSSKTGYHCFIDTIAKKEFSNNSTDHIMNINLKHGPISSINEETYRTPVTRNIPKGVNDDNTERILLNHSILAKKRSMLGTPSSTVCNSKTVDKGYSQKYCTASKKNMSKPIVKKKEKNSSSTRKQPRQILLSGKPKLVDAFRFQKDL